jgi:hypothetical protein
MKQIALNRAFSLPIVWLILLLLTGCHYRKGSAYTLSGASDSITYYIRASGGHINDKLAHLVWIHQNKGDNYKIVYLSDSLAVSRQKSVLLFRSVLPDMSGDMLSKGFMGTFSTKQVVTYLVITRQDFQKFLKPVPK